MSRFLKMQANSFFAAEVLGCLEPTNVRGCQNAENYNHNIRDAGTLWVGGGDLVHGSTKLNMNRLVSPLFAVKYSYMKNIYFI
jgi:hypothetical protein